MCRINTIRAIHNAPIYCVNNNTKYNIRQKLALLPCIPKLAVIKCRNRFLREVVQIISDRRRVIERLLDSIQKLKAKPHEERAVEMIVIVKIVKYTTHNLGGEIGVRIYKTRT